MKITEENKLKGSLFIEAYGSLIDGISKDAESETEKALDITFNAIGAASATVMLAIDPLGSIIGAGVGWLIEHVSFLRDALNQLMGNPEEIQANVEANKARAVELRQLAEDHKSGLATFDGWTGQSSERFKTSMDGMYQELDELASAVETKAKIVAIMGMLVTVLRDIVRDLIAQLIGSLIGGAILAAAAMIPTFGASIPIFCGFAVGKAVALGVNIASRVARVVAALGRQMKRIGDVDDIMKKISKGWERFENGADAAEIGYEGYKAQNDVDKAVDEARGGSGQTGGQTGGQGTGTGTATAGATASKMLADTTAAQGVLHNRVGTVQADGTATATAPMMARMAQAQPAQQGVLRAKEALQPMQQGELRAREAVRPAQQGELRAREALQPMQAAHVARMPDAPLQAAHVARMPDAPLQPMQAAQRIAAEPLQPMQQAVHRTEMAPLQPMQQSVHRTEMAQPVQPLQAVHRTEMAQPLQPVQSFQRVEAQPLQPMQAFERVEAQPAQMFQRADAATDSTMVSGVSQTAGAPVHDVQPMQAREMYYADSTPSSEPLQPMSAGYEPMARTQMSYASDALEPAQPREYSRIEAQPVYESVNPLMANEPLRPTAAFESDRTDGGAARP
ncbi:hypothetical protein [Lentzea sp. NPDC059081]|uniref:hypothetical protein n=1 Tax=Lentzea sp. NPDC059081 TaxID=3346719 RepID=UPI0036B8EC33